LSGQHSISEQLADNVRSVHGKSGDAWLARLPDLIGEFRERWSLELDQPFQNLSFNLVIPGRDANNSPIVLKLGVPCTELFTEAAALEVFESRGAVRLLAHDSKLGALLLERISPGTQLHELGDEAHATQIAAALMRQLWREPRPEHAFPSIATWFRSFERLPSAEAVLKNFARRAEPLVAKLIDTAPPAKLLHGDLHHENILKSAERGWLAIDPKGVCGDPGYEIGPFMLNKLPLRAAAKQLSTVMTQRLSIFSRELGIDYERLALWSFCYAVLSAVWSYQDNMEFEGTLRLAEILWQLT